METNKTQITLFIIFVFFTSCSDSFPFLEKAKSINIQAHIKNASEYVHLIDSVEVIASSFQRAEIIGKYPLIDETFSLDLKVPISKSAMRNISDFIVQRAWMWDNTPNHYKNETKISNNDALYCTASFYGVKNGGQTGVVHYSDSKTNVQGPIRNGNIYFEYMYVDRSLTITGYDISSYGKKTTYNLILKKGWNLIMLKFISENESEKTSEILFDREWNFSPYY